jgi:hypothetical protein
MEEWIAEGMGFTFVGMLASTAEELAMIRQQLAGTRSGSHGRSLASNSLLYARKSYPAGTTSPHVYWPTIPCRSGHHVLARAERRFD